MNRLQSSQNLPSRKPSAQPAWRWAPIVTTIVSAILCIVAEFCCNATNAEPVTSSKTREIIFPQTDVGKLFFLGKEQKRVKDWIDVGNFTFIGSAKDKVKVPPDVPLFLKLSYAATEKPQLVGEIPHDVLTFIDGNRMPVEDPVCEYIAKLESLEKIDLAATEVTDEGVKKFAKMPKLKVLYLEGTNARGEFVDEFARCKSGLRFLRFGNDSTTPTAWKMLAKLKDLRRLDIYHCRLTDEAFQYIGQMTSLEQLCVPDNPKLTDAGIHHLKNLKHLNYLSIEGTHVTIDGICELKGLPITRLLVSSNTDSKAANKLKAAFPNVTITVKETKDNAENRYLYAPLK